MGLFDKMRDPVFVKESSQAEEQVHALEQLLPFADKGTKEEIEQDIKMLSYGIAGEKNIAFELKNSHMPMCVLHDVYFEFNGLTAQIDYIVITRLVTFIIECKNLIGDIEIKNNGDFVRTYLYKGRKKSEGFYSPITQNKRHLELIKEMRASEKGTFQKLLFEKCFYDNYQSVVVLANSKTILNAKFAKKEIKDNVIRADQLIDYIKRVNINSKTAAYSDKAMLEVANYFMSMNKVNEIDYSQKYGINTNQLEEIAVCKEENNFAIENTEKQSDSEEQLIVRLKEYRLKTSRDEKVKAYFIFNDAQMMDLITKHPKTKEELKKVSGFGPVKAEKYGDRILEILNQ